MMKIVALYFCSTIFLVSGNGNATSGVVSPVSKPTSVEPTVTLGTDFKVPFEPTDKTEPPHITTTEPQPNTTTTTTTTTTSTTTTTTTTTTTVAPVTTPNPPVPTPAPAPKTATWMVNGTNETCIVVQMAVQFNVSYETTDNKTLWQELTLPANDNSTLTSGSCGRKEQILNIMWATGDDNLVFHFTQNDTDATFSLHRIEVTFGIHEFPNIKPKATMKFVHQADQFPTGLSNSYRCMRLQKLGLMRNASNETTAYLEISNLQFQAFKVGKNTGFGAAEDCAADVPDVVPIAVGCALTVLVIIVLAAYLIGRRRSQARGYLSM